MFCFRFWWESQKERDHSEDLGVDGSLGSEWILGRLAGERRLYIGSCDGARLRLSTAACD
jgi:hypothetical protein